MNRSQALTLSIIILAYNEERHIEGCLRSIERQTVKPDEVIVVNNNSVDRTVEIAKQFPFAKVVHETTQGLIPARNHGFRVAKGNILARIDCDARLNKNWVSMVKHAFADPKIAAVTGNAETNIIPFIPWPNVRIFSWSYHILARDYFKMPVLWGSNMAIRRSAWQQIETSTNPDDKQVHEDLDMTVLLWSKGLPVRFMPNLRIYTGGEQFLYLPKLLEYKARRGNTKRVHERQGTFKPAQRHAAVPLLATKIKKILILPVGLIVILGAIPTTLFVWGGRLIGVRINL